MAQTFTFLDPVTADELIELKAWLKIIKPYMFDSVSSYAPGRKELHLRNFVKLVGSKDKSTGDVIKPIESFVAEKYQSRRIEEICERLLPNFHQGLVLYYPKGTSIKPHRDSSAYAKGAASINIIGDATFYISHNQDSANMESIFLGEGHCIWFDNKQPHAVGKVTEDRWCICLFHLKELQKPKQQIDQLTLFSEPEPAPKTQELPTPKPHRIPRIYASYYVGQKIGKAYSISLYPPKTMPSLVTKTGQKLFTPTPEILSQWKRSAKDEAAEEDYTKAFTEVLNQQSQAIDQWLDEVYVTGQDITVCCYEKPEQFCHRHSVMKYIEFRRPDMWGGEVETEASELEKLATDPKFLQMLGHPAYQEQPKPKPEKPSFPNPRYTWVDQEALARWWNPYGEEISCIKNPATGETRFDVKAAENVPPGWVVVLCYWKPGIPVKDLIFVG